MTVLPGPSAISSTFGQVEVQQTLCTLDIAGSLNRPSYNAPVPAPSPTPPDLPVPDLAATTALAPEGVLRAGINLSNFLLVGGTGEEGEPYGVSPSIATRLAGALGVPVELVGLADPTDVVDALVSGVVDIGNVGADPSRAEHLVFTAPYCEIDSTYLVRPGAPISSVEEADRPGVRIVSKRGAAYTLWLDRNIERATVIHTDSIEDSFEIFVANGLEVLAGLRPRLLDDSERVPGSRLLDGRFTAVRQAIGIRRDREDAGLPYLERFVDWAVASGLVAELIEHHGVIGLSLPAPRGC